MTKKKEEATELAPETNEVTPSDKKEDKKTDQRLTCGIVMPISAFDDYTEDHWKKVEKVISEAVREVGFVPDLVSNSDEVRVIHGNIVQNLYDSDIVVCDVSGKNPNVMFELGLRLAFDKPTVIIKDEVTSYVFDIGGIQHLPYFCGLPYYETIEFKRLLGQKVRATYEAYKKPDYITFLKHFKDIRVAKIDQKEIPGQDYIIKQLDQINREIGKLKSSELIDDDYKVIPKYHRIISQKGVIPSINDEIKSVARDYYTEMQFSPSEYKALEDMILKNFVKYVSEKHPKTTLSNSVKLMYQDKKDELARIFHEILFVFYQNK